jgi:hypothetical protein
MNPLQLTYPSRECVRCHRHTHEDRLCAQCRADDELVTRATAQALRWASSAFSVHLGYQDSLDRVEATTDWFDHGGRAT